MYTCPVCGFDQLEFPPEDFNICPSCGTDFDLDDVGISHAELRDAWKAKGMHWWSLFEAPPIGWDAQLLLDQLVAITQQEEKTVNYKFEELSWYPVQLTSLSASVVANA